jgi:hypothetical protein
MLLAFITLSWKFGSPMGKYCYCRSRRRVIEEFTHWQGLWILALLSALAIGSLLLYVLGYLHLDVD